MCSYRKSQTNVHPAAVAFNWGIQELLDLSEGYNLIELSLNLSARHSQYRPVQKDVFPTGKLGMKTSADFQQTRYPATNADAALRRLRNPAESFQQRGLATAVAADNANDIALADFKIDVAQCPDL